LHARAHELGSMGSALDHVADGIRVLCFDEFHIDDVADAMFMARVLDTIVAKGVTVVVTSNLPPTELLPNPLFHEQFVPSIELIELTLEVIELGGSIDYRTAGQPSAGDYRFATGEFLVDSEIVRPSSEGVELTIGTRTLACSAIRDGVVWFDFAVLCGGSTSAADYLELASRFDDWVIFGVPVLEEASEFAVRRFGNVVDVLYDVDARLTVYADACVEEVAGSLQDVPGLARLYSRLSLLARTETDSVGSGSSINSR
ncbi:MAG: cell division protein ZapE, partial [Rhodococcus sp. (in: high G+C Gram-positive bacteria)]